MPPDVISQTKQTGEVVLLQFNQPYVAGRLCVLINNLIARWGPGRIANEAVQFRVICKLLLHPGAARDPVDIPNAVTLPSEGNLVSVR